MAKRILIPAVLLALVAACSDQGPVRPPPAQEIIVKPEAAQHPDIAATKFIVTPASIRAGQPATIHIELQNATTQTPVIIGWFGPDHWNVVDQFVAVTGSADMQVPVNRFAGPGTYDAHLRAGNQWLGQTSVTVVR